MSSSAQLPSPDSTRPEGSRLDYLDAARAFALVLGIVFHASLSFLPVFIGWAVQDVSTGSVVGAFFTVSHSFRMELFFLLAGFFGCVTLRRKGATAFVQSRALRLIVPFVVGWFILRPLIVSGWLMGAAAMRGDYEFWSAIEQGIRSLNTLPAGIFTGSHLWFLYYLAMITAIVLVARAFLLVSGPFSEAITRRTDATIAWLARSKISTPLLAVPTALTLWFMSGMGWGMATPDQSLKPHLPVLLIYGGFFVLGWLVGRQSEAISGFARLTPLRWTLAVAAVAVTLYLGAFERDPGHPNRATAHVAFVVSYAVMMWSLVWLTIGVFKRFFSQPRAWVRYVADSSYWLYLVHLPVVVWLQVAVSELPLHWSLKLTGVSAITLAVCLLTYDLLVRPTFVGWLLNGHRRESEVLRRSGRLLRRNSSPTLSPSITTR